MIRIICTIFCQMKNEVVGDLLKKKTEGRRKTKKNSKQINNLNGTIIK